MFSASCSDSAPVKTPEIASGTYVGQVEGSDARVAVVVGPTSLVVFVCGGSASYETSTVWFRANRTETTQIDLSRENRKIHLDPAGATTLAGGLELGDGSDSHNVRVTRVGDDAIEGLYEVKDAEGQAGVVVSNADEAQGAFIQNITAKILQIVPIRPIALVENRFLRVNVANRTIEVSRVVPK
ncbi:MAG TPA: hypothetical protein VM580_25905 [Labilithrix sp.]|nr:hypothetical protein [Labilithrix sp.]